MTWNMDDPRWTAYVLDELDAPDREQLEGILARDAEARAYVASLRETIGALEAELGAQPAPAALDELQRARITRAARPSRRTWWIVGGFVSAAACGTLVFALSSTTSRDAGRLERSERDERVRSVTQQLELQSKERANLTDRLEDSERRLGNSRPALDEGARGSKGEAQHARQQAIEQARTAGILGPNTTSSIAILGEHDGNTEGYSRIDDNPFFKTQHDPLSTFSIDVDTASYSNLRRFLTEGQRPPKDAVRIEEMINYFKYEYPQPTGNDPFSITTEVGPAPWDASHQLVRIGLQTAAIDVAQVPARNLVFLIDTSGSMQTANKLPLLVQSLGLLVETLRPQDRVSIVVYAGSAGLVLDSTNDKEAIRGALTRLEAGGSTNGGAGIQRAYDVASHHLIRGGINRVILCSDGDMNVGITSEGDLTRLIEHERARGVFLTVLGFGMGNLKDATMEKLADRGNGNYAYIDSLLEAQKVLVKEAGATLVTVAKDVKLQLELNPATVAGYRLIGYENRILAHQDFNDDKKDAGDISAGRSVTAVYEIVPAGVAVPSAKVDDLKYQTPPAPAHTSTELLTVKIRYKAPDGTKSMLMSRAVEASSAKRELSATSNDYRWVSAIAGFGMLLRESPYRGNLSWPVVTSLAVGAIGTDPEGYRAQAVKLVGVAAKLPASTP